MVGQRKGFKKYDSADLKALRDGLAKAVEVKEAALGAILQVSVSAATCEVLPGNVTAVDGIACSLCSYVTILEDSQ
jgi:hypothetical protein